MKNTQQQIGEKIKSLRENSGFSQHSIAMYLEIDQSLVSKIESGTRTITADALEKLAVLFGVTVPMIVNDEAGKMLSCAFRATTMTAEDMKAVSMINQIALNSVFMRDLLKGK